MDGKVKELVAIGSSIGANCTPCLKHHLRLAKEYGATDDEIKEALEMALKVKKNSTRSIDKLIESTYQDKPDSKGSSCC